MNKRIKGIAIVLLFTLLGTITLYFSQPSFLFKYGESILWNVLRCIFLSSFLSCAFMGAVLIYLKRAELKPYFTKLIKYKPLLLQLVRRDFLAKYKRSVLGVLWSILNPLLTMTIMSIVFSFIFRFEIDNYPVYILSGNILFSLFSEITNQSLYSVISAAPLMKKVSVPKYIFPISRAISSLINFAFSFFSLIIVMIFTHANIGLSAFFFPVPVLYTFLFSVGIGLILSSAMVFFHDVSYLFGIVITAITYFTPMFYPISIIPSQLRWIISLNPLYHFVECFRSCVIYGVIPSIWQNIICFSLATISFGFGLIIFEKKQDNFILYI